MAANAPEPRTITPRPRWRRRHWLALIAIPAAGLFVASLWFTAPLDDPSTAAAGAVAGADEAVPAPEAEPEPDIEPEAEAGAEPEPVATAWPEDRLEGDEAKRFLLEWMRRAAATIDGVEGYTCTFRKHERVQGTLRPEQTMAMKVRHRPFSVYFKFLAPKAGKEAVYVEGARDGKVIGHNGDWTRRLIPRFAVNPTDPIAMTGNRHPITEAGLAHLVHELLAFRELDVADPEAATVLDRVVDDEGRTWYRALHTHPRYSPDRPFAEVEVLYDPETGLPHRISSYDWPAEGDTSELKLAERYTYDDVDLGAVLDDADFDPANPEYAFTRF